jgi:peptidoglycan/xylan/chitin deacetylase (PgdA/CDA1 family)
MSWTDIASLAKSGHDIESHTCNHLSLNTLDNQTLFQQIGDSQQILRSKGYAANILVYPFGEGTSNQTVKTIVSQYYLLARGTDKGTFNIGNGDKFAVNAFGVTNTTTNEQFKTNLNSIQGTTVAILYYHRIGDGSISTMVTKDQFQTQMQYLKDNNFTVLTMGQLFLKQAPTD